MDLTALAAPAAEELEEEVRVGSFGVMQRPGRNLQRSGSKRVLDQTNGGGSGGGDDDHAAKRPRVPALARCVFPCAWYQICRQARFRI